MNFDLLQAFQTAVNRHGLGDENARVQIAHRDDIGACLRKVECGTPTGERTSFPSIVLIFSWFCKTIFAQMLKYLLYYAKDNKKVLSLHRLLVVNCKYYLNMRSWPTKRKR